jgi:hypothetical protein
VEFKEKVSGLDSEDLVAFANSSDGGSILIGVREINRPDGTQSGEPVGHKVDDGTRLQIMDKALSCSPPVQIDITIENLNAVPFLRVDIPSGSQKPYATKSGTYKIRENGRNGPIHPPQLLKMFMEHEGEQFKMRFAEATARIDEQLKATLEGVANLESGISEKIESIGSNLGWADYKVGETTDSIDAVQALVRHLIQESNSQTERLRAIARKVEAADPVKRRAEERLRNAIMEQLKKEPEIIKKIRADEITLQLKGPDVAEFDEVEANKIFTDVLKEIITVKKTTK